MERVPCIPCGARPCSARTFHEEGDWDLEGRKTVSVDYPVDQLLTLTRLQVVTRGVKRR